MASCLIKPCSAIVDELGITYGTLPDKESKMAIVKVRSGLDWFQRGHLEEVGDLSTQAKDPLVMTAKWNKPCCWHWFGNGMVFWQGNSMTR